MRNALQLAFLLIAMLSLGACATPRNRALEPTADDMRSALKEMLVQRPDITIPEFAESLQFDHAVESKGIVKIGVWECNPQLQTFEALFSTPHVSMYEVSGRFQQDARGRWRAIPRTVQSVSGRDIGEFWRAHEVDSMRY
jgi:hypothetical protein